MHSRTLDWKPRFDNRSRKYGIAEVVDISKAQNTSVFWGEGTVLDQGSEGACVGFGWAGEVLADPVAPKIQPSEADGNKAALGYYERAKQIDQWEGEDYEGTSVLAGAKVMKELGFISEYRWCFSIEELKAALIWEGPVVIGIPWYSSMYETDNNGIIRVHGDKVGGHCILVTGYIPNIVIDDVAQEAFLLRNSWGSDYGIEGSAFITYSDLEKLVYHDAEMCVPMGRMIPGQSKKLTKRGFCSKIFKALARSYN